MFSHTHFGRQPVHFLLKFHLECGMLLGGPCANPLPLYFLLRLQLVRLRSTLSLEFLAFESLAFARVLRGLVVRREPRRLLGSGEGDRDVDGERERRLCLIALRARTVVFFRSPSSCGTRQRR